MNTILNLVKQRRIWAGVVSVVSFVLMSCGIANTIGDGVMLTDLLTNFFIALSNLIACMLALWSFFKPKK